MSPRKHLAFALDYPELEPAQTAVAQVAAHAGVLKVGLELFVRVGPAALRLGDDADCEIFLDLKLHDIPATVERAVRAACAHGVRYLTLHAGGAPAMIEAARERVEREGSNLCLLAVTVLTSMDQADLRTVGVEAPVAEHAERLARLAIEAGAGGLVCSTQEVARLRSVLGPDPVLVTPGIRPAGGAAGDQKRVGTPGEAIKRGSSLLVVGRPIRDAADPGAAAAAIAAEIAEAL